MRLSEHDADESKHVAVHRYIKYCFNIYIKNILYKINNIYDMYILKQYYIYIYIYICCVFASLDNKLHKIHGTYIKIECIVFY